MASRARRITIEIGGENREASKAFKATAQDADRLGDKLRSAGDKGGRGLREGVEGETDKLGAKLRSAGEQAGDKFAGGITSSLSGLGDAISGGFDVGSITDSLAGALENVGGGLGPVGAGIGAAVGGAVAVGFLEGLDVERAGDKVAAQLDLTAAESERLGSIAGELYSDAYGDSIEEVNEALGAVISSIGDIGTFTDEELSKAGAMALDFAAIWDTDVTSAVGDVGILISTGLAKDTEEAFDLMTAAMQQTPAAFRDELIPAVEEYSGFLASMGFSGAEAFGIMTQSADDFGSFGIDKSMDALKEFQIRATDMSTGTVAAFDTIGLDAETMAARILAGGDTARGAFDDIVEGILGIEDPVDRANTAITLFGTPIEDLSVEQIPTFLENLTGAEGALGDFSGAASDAGDAVNDNLGQRLESMKRTVLTGLVNFVDERLLPAFNAVSDWARDNPETFRIIAAVIGGVLVLAFLSLAIAATQAAIGVFLATWPILLILALVVAAITIVAIHWDTIREKAVAAWNAVKEALGNALEWIKDRASDAKDWLVDRFDDVVSFITGLPGRIKEAASGLFDGIKDAFKSAINAIIGWWNSLDFSVTIGPWEVGGWDPPGPGSFPGFTIGPYDFGFGTPNIPMLAEGGVVPAVPGGMLALIGERRHDEAVIPLDDDPRTARGGDTYLQVDIHMDGAIIASKTEAARWVTEALETAAGQGIPITVRGRRL